MTTIEQWDSAGGRRSIELSAAMNELTALSAPHDTAHDTHGGGDNPSFVWIAMSDADAPHIDQVLSQLHLEPRVENSLRHLRRPTSEELSQGHYLGLATLWYSPDSAQVDTGEIHCLVTGGGVLTLERGQGGITARAGQLLEQVTTHPLHPGAVLRAVAQAVVGNADSVSEDLGEAVTGLERQVFSSQQTDPVEQIYLLKREVAEARRALGPVAVALQDLTTAQSSPTGHRDRGAVRPLVAHVQRCADEVDGYDRRLGDMLQAHLAIVSVRQNEDMRKMSAWAAIAAICTVIAGIYGMNFDHMPELHWGLGYLWALGLMALAGFILFRAFRRSGWL